MARNHYLRVHGCNLLTTGFEKYQPCPFLLNKVQRNVTLNI